METIRKKKTLLLRLKNAEHFNLHEEIITYIIERIESIPKIQQMFRNYIMCFEKENEEFKKFTRLPETKVVVELEKMRNHTLIHIRKINNLATISDKEEERFAAERIGNILHIYKDATRVAYTENSALITNLLEDIRKEENIPFAKMLLLLPLLDRLEKENEEFKEIYLQRTLNNNSIQLTQARANTDKSFFKIADTINALYTAAKLLEDSEESLPIQEEIVDAVNQILRNAENIYALRVPSYMISKKLHC